MLAVPPHAYPGPSLCHGLATLCKGVLLTKHESLNPAVHYVYMERYQQKSVYRTIVKWEDGRKTEGNPQGPRRLAFCHHPDAKKSP